MTNQLEVFYVVMWVGATADSFHAMRDRRARDQDDVSWIFDRIFDLLVAAWFSLFWPTLVAERFFEWLRGAR